VAAEQSQYGTTSKVLHWLIVALLLMQVPLGFWMERSPQNRAAGAMIHLHMSFGFTILALIVGRLIWRLAHPVAAAPSLAPWQWRTAEAVHWLLYALVFATAMTGWLFASNRGWTIMLFWTIPLPHLAGEVSPAARILGPLHVPLMYGLITLAGVHALAAFGHWLLLKDRVMQRMLPGG
jgi:cytochrome b561